MTPRRISLVRDCRGASAAEFAIVLPLLLILIFGVIDGGRFLWEANRAEKATQVGVRMAVVTNVLAPGLISEDYVGKTINGVVIKSGDLIPAAALGRVECNRTVSVCTCAVAPCPNALGTMDTGTFGKLVDRMRTIDPTLTNANVVVTYSGSGLGAAGEGGSTAMDPSPLITVSLDGGTDQTRLKFTPITSLMLATINMPSFSSTLTAEDASGNYSE